MRGCCSIWEFDQILGDDLAGSQALDVHVYPNFLPQIRRYAWYPYRESDKLYDQPVLGDDVAEVTLDDAPLPLTTVIELSAQDHGKEFVLEAKSADGDRAASYVILVMPHTFPPLKTQISSAEDVAPGIITGMQAAPTTRISHCDACCASCFTSTVFLKQASFLRRRECKPSMIFWR